MPITVSTKAPANTKGVPSPIEEVVETTRLPQDKLMGLVSLGVWIAILLVACGVWDFFESTSTTFGYGMPVWALLAILAYLVVGPGYLLGKLRSKGAAPISTRNKPTMSSLLARAAPLFAMPEPAAFVVERPSACTRVWPTALLFSKPLFEVMDDNEASVLAVRGLAHQKLGHARRLAMLDLLDQTPTVTKILVWPVVIYARFLRQLWLPHAEQSADRLASLLIRNPLLMMSAILKEYAACDPAMQDFSITSADVTNWIAQKGHIGMKGEEISTQYKLGRAIHEAPVLEERLQELQRWNDSPDFKAAVDKLASAKKG